MTAPSEHQTNERIMARWTRRVGIFTFFLIVVGIGTGYILYRTDETARLRDRAFLYFGDPAVTPYPPGNVDRWGLSLTIENAGNMPARRVVVEYDCPDAPHTAGEIDPWPLAKWKRAEIGSVIGPKQTTTVQACNVPIATINQAKNNARDVFYLLRVTYLDGFSNTTRVTQVSRIFRFDKWAGALWFIGPHNCSDSDCRPK